MSQVYNTLRLSRANQVDYLYLNRPERKNAVTAEMVEELLHYWGERQHDDSTRVIVLSGEGGNFTAGLDLKEPLPVLDASAAEAMRFMRDYGEIVLRMRRCPQPIIAMLQGIAVGGGLALALAADIRLAAQSTRMSAAFVRLGLSGTEMGVSYLLPRLVGGAVAADLCLTGRIVSAAEALELGLLSRVWPDEELAEGVEQYVEMIMANDDLAIRLTKETLNASLAAGSLDAAIAMENRNQSLAFCGGAPKRGVQAFLEQQKHPK